MDILKVKKIKRQFRARRVRAKIFGRSERPRLCVFRSNKHIYAQMIDDSKGITLVSASDLDLPKSAKTAKADLAKMVGQAIAKKGLAAKIKQVVFDKGQYKYHGLVKALAEGAREGGLKF